MDHALQLLKRYPLRLILAAAFLPVGIIGLTDGTRTLAYHYTLHRITLQPNEREVVGCDGSEIAGGSAPTNVDCIRIVPIGRDEQPARVTYYSREPNSHRLWLIRESSEPLTIWYADRESRVLFTRFGTLRAARLGSDYLVDVVSTFLERRRLAARSLTLGVFVLFVMIPAFLWGPARTYLQSTRPD